MFKNVKKYIIDTYKPDIIFNEIIQHINPIPMGDISCTFEVDEQIENVIKIFKNKDNVLIDKNGQNIIKILEENLISFDGISSEYINFAFFADINKYYCNPRYIIECIQSGNKSAKISIYNQFNIFIGNKYIKFNQNKYTNKFTADLVNNYINKNNIPTTTVDDIINRLNSSSNILKGYTTFQDKYYTFEKFIPQVDTNMNILFTNLSFNSYSMVKLPFDNMINFNISKNEYTICGISVEEFIETYKNILTIGLIDPLLVNIDNGLMYSPLIIDSVKLYIAMHLKLPYIPVILYTSNIISDEYMEFFKTENMEKYLSGIVYLKDEIEPYMLISNKDYNENDEYIYTKNGAYFLKKYKTIDGIDSGYKLYCLDETKDGIDEPEYSEKSYEIDISDIDEIMTLFE